MKKVFLFLLFISLHVSYAQDLIILKDSFKVYCKITKVDSLKIYYLPHTKDNKTGQEQNIGKSFVLDYFSAKFPGNHTVKLDTATKIAMIKSNPEETKPQKYNQEKCAFGFGAGLDYGGFGVNLTFYPIKNIGLFAGGGYALAGMGYNLGVKLRYTSNDKDYARFNPFIAGMYGYNTAISVKNADIYNKLFYGTSFGIGVDTRRHLNSTACWSFALYVPMRGTEVDDYIAYLKTKGVVFTRELLPFAFSIGFKILF